MISLRRNGDVSDCCCWGGGEDLGGTLYAARGRWWADDKQGKWGHELLSFWGGWGALGWYCKPV
jgi:hypothetical protein